MQGLGEKMFHVNTLDELKKIIVELRNQVPTVDYIPVTVKVDGYIHYVDIRKFLGQDNEYGEYYDRVRYTWFMRGWMYTKEDEKYIYTFIIIGKFHENGLSREKYAREFQFVWKRLKKKTQGEKKTEGAK